MKRAVILLLLLSLSSLPTAAGEWDLSGSVGAELRLFPDSPAFDGQFSGAQASGVISPELRWASADREQSITVVPFLRVDSRDDKRTHFDLREASWRRVAGDWELLAGVHRVFWGVTESRHLVDVINQRDLVEDIDLEEVLGQPMVLFGLQRAWGRLEFFTLLGFRERTFPGLEGRLRTPVPIDTDRVEYESGAEEQGVDLALRYSHFIGDWDLGLNVYYGTGREPVLRPGEDGESLIPRYQVIQQVGVDLQYTRGAWLWKLEGLMRSGQGQTFGASVAGFEYTLYQVFQSAADLGLLFEYLVDGRDEEAPFTVYDDDLFFGTRLGFNDTQDTSILLGAVIDRQLGSTSLRLEAGRRLGSKLVLEMIGQAFVDVAANDPLQSVAEDSYLTLRLKYHF